MDWIERASDQATVTTASLNVRVLPASGAKIAGTVTLGKKVQVAYRYGNWYFIRYGSLNGWVSGEYLLVGQPQVDVEELTEFAKSLLGIPYVWGGTSTSGFDCSGFTCYVFAQFGIYLERLADDQYDPEAAVAEKDLKAGDLVFFSNYCSINNITHVGIYLGDGTFIHAANEGISITQMDKAWYAERYVGACRVLPEQED